MKLIYKSFFFISIMLISINVSAQTIWNGDDIVFSKPGNANWKLEENQDRITDNVWLTRQDRKPIYNFKWWQDNIGSDPNNDALEYEFYGGSSPVFTPSGGTQGVRWGILDASGATGDWSSYDFATLGDPTNFHSFNNILRTISIMESETGDFSQIEILNDFFVIFNGDTLSGPKNLALEIVNKKLGVWLVEDDVYLTLTFSNWGSGSSGGGSFSYTRSTKGSVSTSDVSPKDELKVFPNPSRNQIKISGLISTEEYSITNLLGSLVQQGSVSNQKEIDILGLNKGIYFLEIQNTKIKFIKE